MISILIQVLICGIATVAICQTIAYHEGPFHIFSRMKKSLLPESQIFVPNYEIEDIRELQEFFSKILMDTQSGHGEEEMWEIYQTLHNPKFYLSFLGTMYNILDCPFCLGPYVSIVMSSLMTFYVMMTQPMGWYNLISGIIVALGSYGLHFIVTKKWEGS